jgi:hypothetical protein
LVTFLRFGLKDFHYFTFFDGCDQAVVYEFGDHEMGKNPAAKEFEKRYKDALRLLVPSGVSSSQTRARSVAEVARRSKTSRRVLQKQFNKLQEFLQEGGEFRNFVPVMGESRRPPYLDEQDIAVLRIAVGALDNADMPVSRLSFVDLIYYVKKQRAGDDVQRPSKRLTYVIANKLGLTFRSTRVSASAAARNAKRDAKYLVDTYEKLRVLYAQHTFSACDVWNADEVGISSALASTQ